MKGLVGGRRAGSVDCRRNWTAALIPRSSGIGTHPTSAECAKSGANCLERWKAQIGTERDEEAGPKQKQVSLDILTTKWRQETCWKSAASCSTHS